MAWASLCATFAALTAIGLSMDRHQEQMLGRELGADAARAWRAAGWLALPLAAAPCLAAWGASVGAAAWLGVLTGAAMGVGLLLTYAPRLLPRVAAAAVPAAAALALAA